MTRATLLHVLERPTALGPAEVRELEQLAEAFPYCQTAHLLLAKAAHDQGTMLAGQRLRRAATYAADRTLLRRLIEQEEATPAAAPAAAAARPEPVLLPPAPHPLDLVDWPDEYVPPAAPVASAPPAAATLSAATPLTPAQPALVAEAAALPPPPAQPEVIGLPEPAPAPAAALPLPTAPAKLPVAVAHAAQPPIAAAVAAVAAAPAAAATLAPFIEALAPVPAAAPVAAAPVAEAPITEARIIETPVFETPAPVMPAAPVVSAVATAAPAAAAAIGAAAAPEPVALAAAVAVTPPEPTAAGAAPAMPELLPTETAIEADAVAVVAPEAAPTEAVPLPTPLPTAAPAEAAPAEAAVAPVALAPEAELPPQAPAIRPPVEVGEARFEFGLADPAPATPGPTYELPGLVDEWAASAVTRSLGSPDALATAPAAPVAPAFTPAAFTGDATVGYAYGESSRLGLSMQLLDLLTARAEAAGSTPAVVAAAQPPASALPPTGTFFEPDPLLLGHWATHRPVPAEQPTTLDLINNFLKRQPRLTRPAMLPPSAGHQADLSVRSTRAEPDLVSENLARIFVRQGKTARAIEIYEKLMVKQPEKMAYFALQIQSLQPSA